MFSWLFGKKFIAPEVDRRALAALLLSVADSQITAREAIHKAKEFPGGTWADKQADWALHFLHHFDADVDIRERDEGYAQRQVAALRSLAKNLVADRT